MYYWTKDLWYSRKTPLKHICNLSPAWPLLTGDAWVQLRPTAPDFGLWYKVTWDSENVTLVIPTGQVALDDPFLTASTWYHRQASTGSLCERFCFPLVKSPLWTTLYMCETWSVGLQLLGTRTLNWRVEAEREEMRNCNSCKRYWRDLQRKKLIQLNNSLPGKSFGSLKDKTLPFLSFSSAGKSFRTSWKQIFDSEPNDKS